MLSRQEVEESVLKRDDYRCKACGLGGDAFRAVISCHHLVPSSVTTGTGITLCLNCIQMMRETEEGRGAASVSEDDMSNYSDKEQYCLTNIKKLEKIKEDAKKELE